MHGAFKVHTLTDEGKALAEELASAFDQLLEDVIAIVGKQDGREMAIVTTKLEEACFFAKKALAKAHS